MSSSFRLCNEEIRRDLRLETYESLPGNRLFEQRTIAKAPWLLSTHPAALHCKRSAKQRKKRAKLWEHEACAPWPRKQAIIQIGLISRGTADKSHMLDNRMMSFLKTWTNIPGSKYGCKEKELVQNAQPISVARRTKHLCSKTQSVCSSLLSTNNK